MTNNPPHHDSAPPPIRVAMWSGPRNISTALMRSWGARPDAAVSDEPLYGHYLRWLPEDRRREHPGAAETMAAMDCDWRSVTRALLGPTPGNRPVWYQKHMAHHLTPGMDLDWIDALTNCFLIRDPAAMITSFAKVIPNPTPEDLGLPAQVALFERLRASTGRAPAVIDSADVLGDPEGVLRKLCQDIGIEFHPAMLAWEPGPRDTDGVWAPHWYANVNQSTGFSPPRAETPDVPKRLEGVLDCCNQHYRVLSEHRIAG